jgi:oligopeptide/dipeptide ABC transporter ATP-binding protein
MLLRRLSRQGQLGVLYISHDIATVRYLCDRIAVMYLGRIVEEGPAAAVLAAPKHPYTAALVAAVPRMTGAPRQRVRLAQATNWRGAPGSSCSFGPRCPVAAPICETERPPLRQLGGGRSAACHFALPQPG